ANAAVWPDYFAHKPEGRYSKGWHYIDAKDDPPTECGVQFERDCKEEEGCVVAAIVNMVSSRYTIPSSGNANLNFLRRRSSLPPRTFPTHQTDPSSSPSASSSTSLAISISLFTPKILIEEE